MPRAPREIPVWLIAVVVVITAGITVWAMFGRAPVEGWPADAAGIARQVTQVLSPPLAGINAGAYQPVAGLRRPPPIQAGQTPPHPNLGACTLCHVVLGQAGKAIPMITALAALPHRYRGGICTNCHLVTGAREPVGARPAAFAALAPAAVPARVPREGAWLGMEVGPVTPLTAGQYRIPAGIGGVVVSEAESVASVAGVRAGDVVTAIDGVPVADMAGFLRATQYGTLAGGTVDLLRTGRAVRLVLGSPPTGPAAAWPGQAAAAPGWAPGYAGSLPPNGSLGAGAPRWGAPYTPPCPRR